MSKSDQGVSATRYKVIPRTLIFVTKGDEVLLLKGAPSKRIWANCYNGLGGHIERGEDVITAAKRELFEESGLKIEELNLCGTVMVDAGDDIGITIFVLKGEYHSGDVVPSSEGTLVWVKKSEWHENEMVEDLPTLLPQIIAFQKGDRPFSARYRYSDDEKLIIEFGI
jgi:8-oxo-dGTP diphosphatase